MAYWYLSNDETLLLDLDDYEKPVQRYQIWGEMFRQRLRDAINAERLKVREVWIEESNSHNHFHAFIRLSEPMPLMERMCWQLRLASDWKRAHADLMRAARGIEPASLLIRTAKVEGLWRVPDYVCPCEKGKHVTLEQVELLREGAGCPVWRELRGATPWELFGRPANRGMIERPVNLSLGRVPISEILQIGELKGEAL